MVFGSGLDILALLFLVLQIVLGVGVIVLVFRLIRTWRKRPGSETNAATSSGVGSDKLPPN